MSRQTAIETANSQEELDLLLAAQVQSALLPKSCLADCPHHVADARNRMCAGVGGDFYDFLRINDEQIALLIGDVVGHGVRAALLMATIMGWLRSDPANRSRPGQVIAGLNNVLLDLNDKTGSVLPCSMFYAVIDEPSGVAFFVNAGHPRPFLCDKEICSTLHLGPRNMLLGVEEFEPQEGCYTFAPGQRLVMYTDGIVEASNPQGDYFGEQRFHHVISQCADKEPSQLTAALFDSLDDFRQGAGQTDDETVVVVDRI